MSAHDLTDREYQVLAAYARTGSYKDAAHVLGISENTVKAHIASALRRLDVEGSIEAFGCLGWLRVPSTRPS